MKIFNIMRSKILFQVETAARNYAKDNNLKFISPYNDVNIIRGQGTCGVEILEQCRKKFFT